MRRGLVLLATVIACVSALAAPAAAHGGGALFEVLEAAEVSPGTVSLRVAVRYESDGDDAVGALVDVVPTSPTGRPGPAVRLVREEGGGTYAALLELGEPGQWDLALTSSFPPGSTTVAVQVLDPAVAGGRTAVVPAGEDEAAATTEGRSAPDGGAADDGVVDEPEAGGAEGGSDATNLIVAAVSGILGGGLGLWVSRRRAARRRAAPPG
jgi:hypothetical protein